LSNLPSGWAHCTLGDLAEYVTSGSRDWSKYYSDVGALFVRTENINRNVLGSLDEIARVALPTSVEGKRTLISEDDLLITITGANVGKCAHIDRDLPEAYVSQSVALVRLADRSCARFVHRQLIAPGPANDRTLLQGGAYGLGRPVLNLEQVRSVPIRMAPLPEQRRIVERVDALLSRVDACRQHLDRVSALLRRFRHSVLDAAANGELTEEWREHRGRNGVRREVKLGELLSDVRYGTAKKCAYEPRATPVLRIPNVADGLISHEDLKYAEFDDAERAKLELRLGDVLVIRSNGSLGLVGRAAVVTKREAGFLYAGYLIRLRPDVERVRPGYLARYLESPGCRSIIERTARSTTGVNNLNAEEIRSLSIQVPSLPEQDEIVRRTGELLGQAELLTRRLARIDAKLCGIVPAVLGKAFRGELAPQDPNDEPASVMLETLRIQRAAVVSQTRPSSHRRLASRSKPSVGPKRTPTKHRRVL